MEDIVGRRRWGKEIIPAKNELFQARSPSLGGWQESIRQIMSLVLTRYCLDIFVVVVEL